MSFAVDPLTRYNLMYLTEKRMFEAINRTKIYFTLSKAMDNSYCNMKPLECLHLFYLKYKFMSSHNEV